MTTDNHLNSFAELDCETTENHSKTAEKLLNVENLDFDNTRYLAEILFKLKRYDESIKQLKRALSLSHDDELLTLIGITYFKMGEYETAISIDSRNLNFYLEYNQVNVLNRSESVKFMGNYRVYDRRNYDSVSREINSFLKKYGKVEIKSKKIRDNGMKFTTVSFNFEL